MKTSVPLFLSTGFVKESKFLQNSLIFFWVCYFSPMILLASSNQDSLYQFVNSIKISSNYTTTDNLQNIYVATIEGSIYKFNKEGQKLFEYNNRRLGPVGTIDVRNPFNILVYYPNMESIIILDRTLSEINTINLLDLGILDPAALGIANDNNIWIFDQIEANLKKVSTTGNSLFTSRNLNQITNKNLSPTTLKEWNNQLFLNDPNKGIFVFDAFGQLQQTFDIKDIQKFQIENGQLFYWQNKELHSLALDTGSKRIIPLPFKNKKIKAVNIRQHLLLVIEKDLIEIYKIK